MLTVLDVARFQLGLNWPAATAFGIRACYVKLGGDNAGRYVADSYPALVDASRGQGYITGHYWVTGGYDPAGSARFYCANLRGRTVTDFYVLDNEHLDSGRLWTDAEAATWFRTVHAELGVPYSSMFLYIGAADLRASVWPECEALGVRLIVASYGANTGTRDHEPNLGGRFGGVWAGHQYTSNGYIDGVRCDLNTFHEWAFDYGPAPKITRGPTMYLRNSSTGQIGRFPDGGTAHVFATLAQYQAWRAVCVAHNTRMTNAGTPEFKVTVPPDAASAANFQGATADQWAAALAVAGTIAPVVAPADVASAVVAAVAPLIADVDVEPAALAAALLPLLPAELTAEQVVDAIRAQWVK